VVVEVTVVVGAAEQVEFAGVIVTVWAVQAGQEPCSLLVDVIRNEMNDLLTGTRAGDGALRA